MTNIRLPCIISIFRGTCVVVAISISRRPCEVWKPRLHCPTLLSRYSPLSHAVFCLLCIIPSKDLPVKTLSTIKVHPNSGESLLVRDQSPTSILFSFSSVSQTRRWEIAQQRRHRPQAAIYREQFSIFVAISRRALLRDDTIPEQKPPGLSQARRFVCLVRQKPGFSEKTRFPI
jgi:hypothetical protein